MNLETMRNLKLYEELITCGRNIYSWLYDAELNLIHSNCPNQRVLGHIFALEYKRESLFSYFHSEQSPIILSNSIDMAWAVDIIKDTSDEFPVSIYVIGPIFFSEISLSALERSLEQHTVTIRTKNEILSTLKTVPIIPYMDLTEYAQMLHYCISKEKIPYSQIRLIDVTKSDQLKSSDSQDTFHGTWSSEQLILKMIEDGNLNYRKQQDKLGRIGNIGKLSKGEPLRQTRNLIISFIVLATRAAIRGGLAPETAYTLSDRYIQNVESANSLNELATISYTMQEDFVHRVHQHKLETDISPQIKECRDYIQLHLTEKISLSDLASHIGYSQNYLCKKFKTETNTNIRDYINSKKIEYSKSLLTSTNNTIFEISEILHFCSPSRYCELFRALTGLTPNEFRKKN